MGDEWKRVFVSEVCELIVDCVNKTAPVVEELTPYKMLRTTNVKGGRIDRAECRRVSKETFVKWTRRADVKHGDVILTREAPLGEVGYVDFTDTVFLGQRLMQYRANRALLEPRFLLYSFLSKDLQNQFGAHEGSGSTVSHIRVGDCSKFQLPLPPLAEQKNIAAVLGALDDKIELNRRMNATLEATARALFQSWFVDFDPVRAKLDGRKPVGMDEATAALFSDSFEESAVGHIPKGWEICSLAKKIELLSGGTPKTSEPSYWDGDIPWYSVKDAPSETDMWVIQTEKCVTKLGIKNSAAQILPEGTTIISARGTVGKLALVGTPMAMNQSCYGVRGIKGYGDFFTHFVLRQTTTSLQQRTHGTVFDTITRQTFEALDCIFPPENLTQIFDRAVSPLLTQIHANLHQSRTLATLRDTLLPKLLSGELSVGEVEKEVSA
jgi:type I restriction enzyme S subunit